jgi:hypothetical protein
MDLKKSARRRLFYYETEVSGELAGLQRCDNGAAKLGPGKNDPFDFVAGQVHSFQRSVQENRPSQAAVREFNGSQSTFLKISFRKVTAFHESVFQLGADETDQPPFAVYKKHMLDKRLGKIGTDCFALPEFHSPEAAALKRKVGKIAVLKQNVCKKASVRTAVLKPAAFEPAAPEFRRAERQSGERNIPELRLLDRAFLFRGAPEKRFRIGCFLKHFRQPAIVPFQTDPAFPAAIVAQRRGKENRKRKSKLLRVRKTFIIRRIFPIISSGGDLYVPGTSLLRTGGSFL